MKAERIKEIRAMLTRTEDHTPGPWEWVGSDIETIASLSTKKHRMDMRAKRSIL